MRYFFDTEFYETEAGVTLISIGIVSDDDGWFYAESDNPAIWKHAPEWVRQNVLPRLTGPTMSEARIARLLKEFVRVGGQWRDTELWAYYGAYDWYVLCKLFGGMLNLPPKWPWLFHELRTFLDEQGFPEYTQPEDGAHHALNDARWNRKAFHEHRAGAAK